MKFKNGDIVTGTSQMQKYPEYKLYYKVINCGGPTNYGEPTMYVQCLNSVEHYESLQYQHHFKLANKLSRLLYET